MFKKARAGLTPKGNRILVMLESMLTAGIISVPFMTILYEAELGLSHEQIALTQAAYTLVAMLLNIPLGWVADRFGRKNANITGDACCFIGLVLYSKAQSMYDCILCETIFGVGMAFSQGVDSSLLKHFADKEDPSNDHKLYNDSYGIMSSLCQIAALVYYVIGFTIGNMDIRTIILVSSFPFVFAVIASMLINDDSKRLEKPSKKPKTEGGNKESNTIFGIIVDTMKNPKLNIRIAAFIVAREITHGIIWCFTPLLQSVGIDGRWIVLGWAANSLMAFVGTKLARKHSINLPEWVNFLVPIVLVTVAGSIMSTGTSLLTLSLYTLFGIAQGWTRVTMIPQIKNRVAEEKQCTVESIAKVFSDFCYMFAVTAIGRAADIELRYAALVTLVIFVPFAIPVAIRLRHQEASDKDDNTPKMAVEVESA